MLGTQNLPAFILAGLMLNLMPGPDTMYILGRSIAQGWRAGVFSVLGISSGVLCHIMATAFGLSALWAASEVAFTITKVIGAAYLIYLGVKTILDQTPVVEAGSSNESQIDAWSIYRQGLITNLLNPKISLFFMALLPQFVRSDANAGALPFLFLGAVFVFNGTLWCLFLVFCSARATAFIRRNRRFERTLKRVAGSLFVALGLNLLRAKSQHSN
jgi:threonine/homoserine/homoserine lactone efflux protein